MVRKDCFLLEWHIVTLFPPPLTINPSIAFSYFALEIPVSKTIKLMKRTNEFSQREKLEFSSSTENQFAHHGLKKTSRSIISQNNQHTVTNIAMLQNQAFELLTITICSFAIKQCKNLTSNKRRTNTIAKK